MSNSAEPERGFLFVVSAPSGTGKTTVVGKLIQARLAQGRPELWRSRSYTSRPPRAGETEGVDYNFLSRQEFEAMVHRNEFLEWADLYGNLYGTGRRETEQRLAAGIDVVLVIDVQGAAQVRRQMPEAVGVFVLPPSFDTLAERLRGRNKDSNEAIARRLATARREIGAVDQYDYVIVNDDIERCVADLDAIVVAERARFTRRRTTIAPIVETFGTRDTRHG